MTKYDFNNSRYAKFFADRTNQRYLQTYINKEGILYTNYSWYRSQGTKALAATPINPNDGAAVFNVKSRKLTAAPMMDLRAPLGDSNQMDTEGFSWYSATIPDFISPGWAENALQRDYRVKQFEEFGNDADIVAAWTLEVQKLVDSADATLNNMTAQLMSTGAIDWSAIGRGIRCPLHKANIPDENFVKAGAKVWTDTTARLLDQMKKIEDDYRDARAYTGQLVWQVPRNMFFNVFLANEQVLELVTSFKNNPMAWQAQTGTETPTEAVFRHAMTDFNGVSTIEIVAEKERNKTHTTDTFIHGWNQTAAVLRPAGNAVEFQYKECLDKALFEKYGASTITKNWATTNDGLGTLVNTTLNNGQYKEWHTDLMLAASPALIETPDHVIVDTATAG